MAGWGLGLGLVGPGRRRRIDALVEGGRIGGKLCIGVFAMLLFAAFVEAFWSSIGSIPGPVKFAAGGVLWALVLGWLAFAGRGEPARAAMLRGSPSDRPWMAGRAEELTSELQSL